MNTEEIRQKLAIVLAMRVDSRIDPAHVHPDSRLREDLNLDSLAMAELLYEIEASFGTVLEVPDPSKMVTIADVVNTIQNQLAVSMAS